MSLHFSLLKPPLPSTPSSSKPIPLTSSFLHGCYSKLSLLSKPSSLSLCPQNPPSSFPIIKAMKSMQGRVVCATNDKTVAVEVTRLAPHPKYKRRVRKKKKYQAHDPENQFKVGDWIQLEKCRPISKMKTFLAVPVVGRNTVPKSAEPVPAELGLPLESQQA
ncbi:40S ribosomal protein S17 [Ancistrocladus abbreviatus]